MYLILEPVRRGIHYGAFTGPSEQIYQGFCDVPEWSAKAVTKAFDSQILAKLRGHGKVFTKVGIILPFADAHFTKPTRANQKLVKQLGKTSLRQKALLPALLVLQASERAWPHLPHFFLFDTHLSQSISRDIVLPPFDYATNKQLEVQPYLLHSYGHKANLMRVKQATPVVSLYLGDQVSAALFEDEAIKDAVVSYSPVSAITGLHGLGSVDYGFFFDLGEKRRPHEVMQLATDKAGLHPMVENTQDLDSLLQIAGLIPRKDGINYDDYSIEAIEWIDLSLRSFIRSLRHNIAAMASHSDEVKTLVVNTSLVPESSQFWPLLTKGGLGHLTIVYSPYTLIQAACSDLAEATDS